MEIHSTSPENTLSTLFPLMNAGYIVYLAIGETGLVVEDIEQKGDEDRMIF